LALLKRFSIKLIIHTSKNRDTLSCLLINGQVLEEVKVNYKAKSEGTVELIRKQKCKSSEVLKKKIDNEQELEII
jgi:hypothetical protein